MAVTLRSNGGVVFRCAFLVVWCTKYRRQVLGGQVGGRLTELIHEVVADREAWLVESEVAADHVRLVVEVDPRYGVHRLVKSVKGRSSHVLREEFPHLRSRLPTLWTHSYLVATVGSAQDATVARYLEQQQGR